MDNSVGSRWWKIDFHAHTPASDDFGHGDNAQKTISPEEWLKAAMNSGLDAVVVTDHNTGAYVDKLKEAAAKIAMSKSKPEWYRPLVIFPGVEISVAGNGERIHVLGVFDPEKDSNAIIGILGKCSICDHYGDDENCFSPQGVAEVVENIHAQNGIAIPAHVDGAKGLLEGMNSLTLELKHLLPKLQAMQVNASLQMADPFDKRILDNVATVEGSDAHVATDIGRRFSWIKMGRPTISALKMALHDHVFCVKPGSAANPNQRPSFYIKNVTLSNLHCCGKGTEGPLTIDFSPNLTSLIGGRGTGKSTVLECLRFAFRQNPDQGSAPRLFERLQKFSQGMFDNDSSIVAEFRFHGTDYKVHWSSDGGERILEEYFPESGCWQTVEHGDISGRFPIGVYSQKQLFELANAPRGLLAVIDQSAAVNRDEWNRRWEQKKSEYLQLCVRARELRNRVQAIEALSTRIADLDKKIGEYQSKGYGEVLKRLAVFKRQDGALRVEDDLKNVAVEIRSRVESLVVPDISDKLFPVGDELIDKVRSIYLALSEKTTAAYKNIVFSIEEVLKAISDYRQSIEDCVWALRKKECEEAYEKMARELKAAGDTFDPELYGRWVAERSQLASEVAKLDSVKHEQEQVLAGIKNALSDFITLREELLNKRKGFIESVIGNNEYVRMTMLQFADMSTLESDIRAILGIEGDRYASSLYSSEDKTGFLADLVNWKERKIPLDQLRCKIEDLKKNLWKGARGEVTGGGAWFDKRLKTIYENNPSAFNEISAYWPEDFLEIKYIVGDKAKLLEHGSAGQKSAAILAFLLAYGTDPLVLDQPEDDLDNSLIMELVVKQLHLNKIRRQLIVATHNPNIVVNGDSEQVCVMKFAGGLIGIQEQDSLDDSSIRQSVCEIMEGGEEAFKKRFERMLGEMENV